MFAVHAVVLPPDEQRHACSIGLWAEDSAAPLPPRKPGRAPKRAPHPFAASAAQLADLIKVGDDATTTVLTLPSQGRRPLDSPQLLRDDPPAGTGAVVYADWTVPVLPIDDAGPAVRALADSDVAIGSSVTDVVDAQGFAAELVTRGRVLPGVASDPPRAVWRPLLTGPDAAWARTLAATASPALTAAHHEPAVGWAALLDELVDAEVRRRLARLPDNRNESTWLAALHSVDGRLEVADVKTLAATIATWQRDAVGGPVRALFRLVEPDDDDGAWQLRFALQAVDEPSLVADADDVWRARKKLPALARLIDDPQETLLGELGRAGRVYPELDAGLRVARPVSLALDVAGAHHFLRTAAPALATAGFGVQLPGWWAKPSARLGLRLTARTPPQPGLVGSSASQVGVASIAEFRHELAIGGEVLSDAELATLAKTKSSMVRLRGQWIELDARRLAAGLRLVERPGNATVGDVLRLGLGLGNDTDELPVESVVADGWLGDLLAGADVTADAVELPDTFVGTLRPYQQRGLAWLDFLRRVGLGGVLADDMGLGKTVQLLALLSSDSDADAPTLLICPMSLVGNWQREAARFTPDLRVHVHHGAERARGAGFATAVQRADLVITTYAVAARDAAVLRDITWRRIVVDEAQAIKNAATKQASAIRSLPAATRIAVTGTPVENRLADLWSILEFVNPGLLGSAAAFRKNYAEPIERHGDDEAAERLRRFTAPFVLRRVKTDKSIIADLPDKLEMDVFYNLTAEQAALYRAVVDDMLERIDNAEGIERRGLVLATMTKLKQICNHPAQFLRDGGALAGRSGKLERLDEIVDEALGIKERALLFTQYAEFGAMLRTHLTRRTGREVLFLHGGVPKKQRDDMVTRFQADDRAAPPLFVLSLKAGGTGLTLTAANHVIHVDRWWNPAVEDQATDRAFRIGQRRDVQVRKFVCAGTVEERIAAMIRDKRGLAARIVGGSENWVTEMSTTQLRDLFELDAAAVVE